MPDLYPDQKAIVDDIVKFYQTPGQLLFCLTGWAGTGKSFTIQRAIKTLQQLHPGLRACLTAPTNKAAKVLRSMAAEYGLAIDCMTIYSSLGLVLDNNDEVKYTKKMREGGFKDMDVVVIDEGSMVNKNVTSKIREAAQMYGVKVIAMGDEFQLPPVKESVASLFAEADVKRHLTENRRQCDGNPILELCSSLRQDIIDGTCRAQFKTNVNEDLDIGIHALNGEDWYDWIKLNFVSDQYKEDPDSFRILAYTNKRVNMLNKAIRRLLVGETVEPYTVGERVITRHPLFQDMTEANPLLVANTDEELTVLQIYEDNHPLYAHMNEEFKVWTTTLKADSGGVAEVYILHEDSLGDHKRMLNKLSKAAYGGAPWRHFWDFKDSFADLQPPHAMTIHRSQGSTYENVFIDVRNCYKNPKARERNQLLYVGSSRPSENLIALRR